MSTTTIAPLSFRGTHAAGSWHFFFFAAVTGVGGEIARDLPSRRRHRQPLLTPTYHR